MLNNASDLNNPLGQVNVLSSSNAGNGNGNGKGCNCKRSKCLKMYCECYLAGFGCTENCKCIGCENQDGVRGNNE